MWTWCPHFGKDKKMTLVKTLGKLPLRLFIRLIQIPLTIIYFVLSFFGSVISGIGWFFGVIVYGATICFWIFGELNGVQIAVAFAIATAIAILPGFLTDFIGEGILFLKKALEDLTL